MCEWYKGKKCSIPPRPVNGILNYMLLVAVLWVQKDAFKLLDSKKYFHHKRFPGLWGERVEKYMTCYQVTPTEQQSLMTFKSSYFEVLKMGILLLQWHLIEELFWIFLPLLFFGRDGGLSWDWCLYYVDALGRWMGELFTQSCSKVATYWKSTVTTSRLKKNWIEHGISFFFAQNRGGPLPAESLA